MYPTETDPYTTRVSRFLKIEDVTWGDEKKDFLVRFRGRLYSEDSAAAYDQAVEALHPLDVTPLFRMDGDRHSIILLRGVIQPRASNVWVNVVMFLLTLLSVLFTGASYAYAQPTIANWGEFLLTGIPFTASLLGILLAHEFGHYLAARFHRTATTLPYFIPFPLSLIGTMGAFIQIKEPPKNKRILLDIGIAGPLAGLVVAIPVLFLGLSLSEVSALPAAPPIGLEGNSLFYLLAKFLVTGQWLPSPVSYNGVDPLLYWVRYFFTATPLPWNGTDILMHPVAFAGWAGLLVTALNLIPAGQLDGGHVLFVLFGKQAVRLVPFILVILGILGFIWSGWWLWAAIIFFMGRVYLEPLDQITTLDPARRAVGILGIVIFFLLFSPVPFLAIAQ